MLKEINTCNEKVNILQAKIDIYDNELNACNKDLDKIRKKVTLWKSISGGLTILTIIFIIL